MPDQTAVWSLNSLGPASNLKSPRPIGQAISADTGGARRWRFVAIVFAGALGLAAAVGVIIAASVGAFNGDAASNQTSPSPPNLLSTTPTAAGLCPFQNEPETDKVWPPDGVTSNAAYWDVYTYPPDYYVNPRPKRFRWPPGAELCTGFQNMVNGLANQYAGECLTQSDGSKLCPFTKARDIQGSDTFMAFLKKYEDAMAGNTIPEGVVAGIYMLKLFSLMLKIEEAVVLYNMDLGGHGTKYLASMLFEPDFNLPFKPASESALSAFALFEKYWDPQYYNLGNGPPNNFYLHVSGALGVLPNTGGLAPGTVAYDTMAAAGYETPMGFETEPYTLDPTRLIPKYFSDCASAIVAHDFLHQFKLGDSSLLCSNRGALAIRGLQYMLQKEKEMEARDSSTSCLTIASREEMQAKVFEYISPEAFDGARKSVAFQPVEGGNTYGVPLLTETEYARILDVIMVPVLVHMENINKNLCPTTPYNFTAANPGQVYDWVTNRLRNVDDFNTDATLEMYRESQQEIRCYASWDSYTGTVKTGITANTAYCTSNSYGLVFAPPPAPPNPPYPGDKALAEYAAENPCACVQQPHCQGYTATGAVFKVPYCREEPTCYPYFGYAGYPALCYILDGRNCPNAFMSSVAKSSDDLSEGYLVWGEYNNIIPETTGIPIYPQCMPS